MAAQTESVQYGLQVDASTNYASVGLDSRDIAAKVQFATILVDFTADNVANDVINLIRLPDGARVLPQLSKFIVTGDPNDGAFTVDVGDAADVDRYSDGANLAAVGIVEFLTSATTADGFINPVEVENTGVTTTDTSLVQLKIITEAGTMAAANIYVVLAYTCL